MRYHWGDFELDAEARRLRRRGGDVLHVEPQVFDVLLHLLTNRDRVVAKTELFDAVWGSRFVGESALTSRIQAIRRAVGDSGRAQHTIRTAHGVGYQFIAELNDTPPRASVTHSVSRRLPYIGDELRGRAKDLTNLARLTDTTRLVTVLGAGGTGKTRLCVEWATRLPPDRPGVFVDLAAVRDGRALGQALGLALGIEAGQHNDIVDACGEYLRSQPHWLIMDNCEHVVGEAAALIARLLDLSPETTMVATSRVPLGLAAEVLFNVAPLPVPREVDDLTPEQAGESPAVELFVDRVRKFRHDFELAGAMVRQVADLCRALDGLPLALELAAGRMNTFSAAELLGRLDQRLDLFGDARFVRPGRHRSLRATVEWSYELLDADSQKLFRHLSVLPGGHSLAGAEWLGAELGLADTWGSLASLTEASLLQRLDVPYGSHYVQLESMRTFGLDRLDDGDERGAALDLAVKWVQTMTADMVETLQSDREAEWDDRIRRGLANLRDARRHLRAEGRLTELVDLSVKLDEWARLRTVSEIWDWADELVSVLDQLDGRDAARALAVAAQAAWRRGRIEEAAALAERALASADDDTWTVAHALSALGVAELFRGNLERSSELWRDRIERDGYYIDRANSALSIAYAGRFDEAKEVAEATHGEAVRSGWPTAIAWSEYVLGEVGAVSGSDDHVRFLEAAIERATSVGSAFTIGVANLTLATSMVAAGEVSAAAERLDALVDHWLRSGTWTQQWTTLRHAAALLEHDDPGCALMVISAAERDPYSARLDPDAAAEIHALRTRLVEVLGPDGVAAATERIDRSEVAKRTRVALASMQSAPTHR